MAKQTDNRVFYVSWIIETYKREHNLSGQTVAKLFAEHEVDKWLMEFYDILHTVSPNYVVQEIDEMIEIRNGNTK